MKFVESAGQGINEGREATKMVYLLQKEPGGSLSVQSARSNQVFLGFHVQVRLEIGPAEFEVWKVLVMLLEYFAKGRHVDVQEIHQTQYLTGKVSVGCRQGLQQNIAIL
jgi:hypothetical protein